MSVILPAEKEEFFPAPTWPPPGSTSWHHSALFHSGSSSMWTCCSGKKKKRILLRWECHCTEEALCLCALGLLTCDSGDPGTRRTVLSCVFSLSQGLFWHLSMHSSFHLYPQEHQEVILWTSKDSKVQRDHTVAWRSLCWSEAEPGPNSDFRLFGFLWLLLAS